MTLYILAALAVVLAATFAWGVLRIRRGQARAFAAARTVREEEIPRLLAECRNGFDRLGDPLDLTNADASASALDRHLSGPGLLRLKLAFARDGFDWYFAMPVGAALGEWLRLHAGGTWQPAEEGGLCLVLPTRDGTATAHPFEKVIKQAVLGSPGDLLAYLATARGFGAAATAAVPDIV